MAFVDTKYETNAGTIVNIRVSTNTAAVTNNTAPTGAIDDPAIWAFASNPGSRRKRQLNARGVILSRTLGTAPNTFTRKTFLPLLTKTAWDDTEKGNTVTVGSVAYVVASLVDEA